jgi:hypothetical protein
VNTGDEKSTSPAASTTGEGKSNEFALIWTIGFAGKRQLPNSERARQAIRTKLQMLLEAAEEEHAHLVAVSSIAIGSDLLFAEECLAAGIPWRGILPFDPEEFLKDDFTTEDAQRFHRCLERAYRMDIAPVDVATIQASGHGETDGQHLANRQRAYLDAGYRVIENSDVVLLVTDRVRGGPGGSVDAWNYAEALKKPIWRWDPQTENAEKHGWPGEAGEKAKKKLFHDQFLADLFAKAENDGPGESVELDTAREQTVRALFSRLNRFAMSEQTKTKGGLQGVLTLHLLATVAAGISFTFFKPPPEEKIAWWFLVFFVVAFAKPVLAALAWRLENSLHHDRHQDLWADARVGAELCRSMLATWNLPHELSAVIDVQDFPRFRRLIRSLLITRGLDHKEVSDRWTLDDATGEYMMKRLFNQEEFFRERQVTAWEQHRIWRNVFYTATGYVICGGALIAFDHIFAAGWAHKHVPHLEVLENIIACFLIVAPFVASYALAMQTIHDTRRRITRYEVLGKNLKKQIERINRTRSDVARLRLITATERMLVEELHEWDSVARHVKV